MRNIKFRGKSFTDSKWVYGSLILCDDKAFIAVRAPDLDVAFVDTGAPGMDMIEVDPETVGEFTGLHDKNGKVEIYKDDILETVAEDIRGRLAVIWDDNRAGWYVKNAFGWQGRLWVYARHGKLIGSIHDNPELLAEVKDG